MIAALPLSGKGARTPQASVRAVRLLAQFYHTSPARISAQELLAYFLHRNNVDGLAPASMRSCYSGIRFFSQHVLTRDWSTLSRIRAHTTPRLPAVLRIEEGRRLRPPAMTTLRAICTALGPESLERSPNLPLAPRKVIRAIQQCQSGPDGHRLSQCPGCGAHHRVQPAWGNRHCPQCQQHKTQQWCQHHLDKQLPGPHCLLPCTVPAPLRPFIRSPQRLAYHALCQASSTALKRLATDPRVIGTDLPGFTEGLPPWGRPLQYHPPIHSSVPGGGLSKDRTTWRPASAHCFVPVKALSPSDRALCKEDMRPAGLLEDIAPPVWTIPWNVHRQAPPHGHSACTSLAPDVFRVAIANSRIVSLTDRTGTSTSRNVGSARPRTAHLDVMECLRLFLQPVLPDGFVTVRPCGFLHASCAIPPATLRLLIGQGHPSDDTLPQHKPPQPLAARCPTCGVPMHVVMRVWTSPKGFVETS